MPKQGVLLNRDSESRMFTYVLLSTSLSLGAKEAFMWLLYEQWRTRRADETNLLAEFNEVLQEQMSITQEDGEYFLKELLKQEVIDLKGRIRL